MRRVVWGPSSVVTFTLRHRGEPVDTARHTRWVVAPRVEREVVRDEGLVGALYHPADGAGARPAILLVGESGGGMNWSQLTAGLLASHGYPSLALAYFNLEGLPPQLDRIPLEYFRTAIGVVRRTSGRDAAGVVVMGFSRGGELALLLGATLSDVAGVVAYALGHAAFQSIAPPTWPNTSSWTLGGQPVPFVPTRLPPGVEEPNNGLERWRIVLQNQSAVARATFQVERIDGPVLMITGRDDQIWPSTRMADEVMGRLELRKFSHAFAHHASRLYPNDPLGEKWRHTSWQRARAV